MKLEKKIIVCVDEHPKAKVLLRAAANKANMLKCKWVALYVETPEHFHLEEEARNNVLSILTLAEEMGAETRQIEAKKIINGIKIFVEEQQNENVEIDTIIIGQSDKDSFFSEFTTTVTEKVFKHFHKRNINVQVTPISGKIYKQSWIERIHTNELTLRGVLISTFNVVLAFVITELLHLTMDTMQWHTSSYNVTALFLISCVFSSLRYGLAAGLYAAILSYLTVHYFYVPPLRDFGVDSASDGISLTIFLASAVIVTFAGAIGKASNTALARKERRLQTLYTLHRVVSRANEKKEALKILHNELEKMLEMKVVFLMKDTMNENKLSLAYPEKLKIKKNDWYLIKKCWDEVRTTGVGTYLNTGETSWRYEPLMGQYGEIGIIGVQAPHHVKLDASFGRLLTAIADQTAIILERIQLSNMMSESRVREEKEKLRALLLSSVSHDLKTPLASIIGAMSVYQRMERNNVLTEEARHELIETTLDEAQRLDSFITNILDITRIESGELKFNMEYCDPIDHVKKVQRRLRQRLKDREIIYHEQNEKYFVMFDANLTEQVFQNILDNACKYSPAGSHIEVSYGVEKDRFYLEFRDHGEGIPQGKEEAIFDKYERIKSSDFKVAGTGLGLAICRGIMESQQGEIKASNHHEEGAVFRLYFKQFKQSNE